MCQELSPFMRQRPATPEQVTGGAPLGGIHRGLREQAAAQQRRNLLRVDRVVFGLPAMASLHGEGMTEEERDAFVSAQVGQPIPGKHACDCDDEALSIGSTNVQKGLRPGLHSAMYQDLAVLSEEAEVHGSGVEVDTAVKWVLRSIQSP
jgi:hypothetical protein